MRIGRISGLCCVFLIVASAARATDNNVEVLHRERSLYRNIVVYEEEGLRCMAFGRTTTARQSCTALAEPSPQRILILGLGGGTLPSAFQRLFPDAAIDAVEIDPAVVRVARKYFGFEQAPKTRVFEEDGRVFVKRMQRTNAQY